MLLDERTLSLLVVLLAIAVVALAAWVAVLHRAGSQLRRRLRRILPGEDAGLDAVLDTHLRRLDELTRRVDAINALEKELEELTRRTLQRVSVVRFNPFPDSGGDQSFAIALLDALGNGVVVSSLHARAETRVFAKQVSSGRSTHALSDEEQEAIRKALAPARA